jgi:hypothetical protein
LFLLLLLYRQLHEAKRLTRRMGDCFTYEMIDITTTHVILPNDNPQMIITLDLILAFIYGWLVTTIDNFFDALLSNYKSIKFDPMGTELL